MANSNVPSTETTLKPTNNAENNDINNNEHENRTCMHGLIRQARYCLEEFTQPDLSPEQKIPVQILNEAKGIVFLTALKGGIGVGGTFGTGIIIVRDKENSHQWNGPIAIALNGLQVGLNLGVQQSEHIIILRDDKDIETFISDGQFRFEGDASIALGTIGRDTNIALSVNDKGYISSASYSLTKGAYIGISMEGQALILQNDCNDEYFGINTNPADVFKGITKPTHVDEDYTMLCQSLNDYIFKQKSEFLSTFIKDDAHNTGKNNTSTTATTTTTNNQDAVTKNDNPINHNGNAGDT
jgi:lipid-binding SYLF domain-containing protein